MDHFPVPKRSGGAETVPACTLCHNLKDRIPLERWPEDIAAPAAERLVNLGVFVETENGPVCFDARPIWHTLAPMARVLRAKVWALHAVGDRDLILISRREVIR